MASTCPASKAANSSVAVPNPITVKLMVVRRRNQVIFAEVGRDMVDLLFGLLTLRFSSAVSLLDKNCAGSSNDAVKLGSLSRLYASATSLNPKFIEEPPKTPTFLALAASTIECSSRVHQQAEELEMRRERWALEAASENMYLYYCCECRSVASLYPGHRCKDCNMSLSELILKQESRSSCSESTGRSYVRDLRYIVADDLGVAPSSGSSCLELLSRLSVDMADLEEKIVEVGDQERLALLRASLVSSTALTDVFLGKNHETSTGQKEAAAAVGDGVAERKRKVQAMMP